MTRKVWQYQIFARVLRLFLRIGVFFFLYFFLHFAESDFPIVKE